MVGLVQGLAFAFMGHATGGLAGLMFEDHALRGSVQDQSRHEGTPCSFLQVTTFLMRVGGRVLGVRARQVQTWTLQVVSEAESYVQRHLAIKQLDHRQSPSHITWRPSGDRGKSSSMPQWAAGRDDVSRRRNRNDSSDGGGQQSTSGLFIARSTRSV